MSKAREIANQEANTLDNFKPSTIPVPNTIPIADNNGKLDDWTHITVKVNTIKDLLSVDLTKWDGVQPFVVLVLGYHEKGDGGGGVFYWDANEDKTNHNGGMIIDPTKTFPDDWSDTSQQDSWFNTTNTGSGCWKRIYSGEIYINWFGAKGDGTTDDTVAIQSAINNSKKCIITKNYKITKPIDIPLGVNISGIRTKECGFEIAIDSQTYKYAFYVNVDRNREQWIVSYPGLLSSKIEHLTFSRKDYYTLDENFGIFIAAGSCWFENLNFRYCGNCITLTGNYNDSVMINRVHRFYPVSNNRYMVEFNILGDGLYINNLVSGLPYNAKSYAGKIMGCGGGQITNCINGIWHFENCYNLVFENNHIESGGFIEIINSDITIRNCNINVQQNPVIYVQDSSSYGPQKNRNVRLENVLFKWTNNGISNDYDIEVGYHSKIFIKDVYRKRLVLSNISDSDIYGIKIVKNDKTPLESFNKRSFINSISSVLTQYNVLSSFNSLNTNTGTFYTLSHFNENSNYSWDISTGTYYYQLVVLYSIDRMIGRWNQQAEASVDVSGQGGIYFYTLGFGSRLQPFYIRLYRGTASGSYDKYVDIPFINANNIVDTGNCVCGYTWQDRTAGDIDSLNDYSDIIFNNNNIQCKGAAPPRTGNWESGDIVWSNSLSVDSNNMMLIGWQCIETGSPGTWKPMYISVVSPAT